MTDNITEPVTPELTDPVPFSPLAGDWKDDDAQVYDDDFSETQGAPLDNAMGVPHAAAKIKPTSRLIHRSIPVGTPAGGAVSPPIMLLPADPNRKSLTLFAYADTQKYFTFGSDQGDCFNGNQYPVFVTTVSRSWPSLTLDGHTGAVWVYSDSSTPVVCVAVAVTE